jgi:2-octaprenyl-6-methoxyphenol hydroxylase
MAVEHFMTQGVFAILPLRDPYRSSIVWCEKEEVTKLYMKMKRDEFAGYLEERFGKFLGKVEIESDPVAFPLGARITKRYYNLFRLGAGLRGSKEAERDPRIFAKATSEESKTFLVVLGDSAHTIHPLAGQGLNQGIKDIEELTNIISRNLSVGLGIDEIALEEYENKRKGDNYAMSLVTDNLNRLFSNNLPGLSHVRKLGLALIQKLPEAKRWLVGRTA